MPFMLAADTHPRTGTTTHDTLMRSTLVEIQFFFLSTDLHAFSPTWIRTCKAAGSTLEEIPLSEPTRMLSSLFLSLVG
jgi:hypothetical protein